MFHNGSQQLFKAVCAAICCLSFSLLYLCFFTRPEAPIIVESADVTIAVRSSNSTQSRLQILLDTWIRDITDEHRVIVIQDQQPGLPPSNSDYHNVEFISGNCQTNQIQLDQCCKASIAFNSYYTRPTKWFCHVDDDNFINIPNLDKLLHGFNDAEDYYLGRPSISTPLEVKLPQYDDTVHFFFATFGAGVCISRSLMLKLTYLLSGTNFINWCQDLGRPDDQTLGFLIYYQPDVHLNVINKFHSHLENLHDLDVNTLKDEVILSYDTSLKRTVPLPNLVEPIEDNSRFMSLYCFIHDFSNCTKVFSKNNVDF